MLEQLEKYLTWTENKKFHQGINVHDEKRRVNKFKEFYTENPNQFYRNHLPGHFTGSAFITNKNFTHVLLTLHAKLNLWLQLGGHADGNQDVSAVALREAQEESGLSFFSFVDVENLQVIEKNKNLIPFDVDCHLIPQTAKEEEHYHYDIAFLLVTDEKQDLQITEESIDLQWFTLQEAKGVATEQRLHRMLKKMELLKEIFKN